MEMRTPAQRAAALFLSAAAFTGTWYTCQHLGGLDVATSCAIAGTVLAAVLALAAWWAPREPPVASASGRLGSRTVRSGPQLGHRADGHHR
jgi:CHASE2 domain-containing sensor protein